MMKKISAIVKEQINVQVDNSIVNQLHLTCLNTVEELEYILNCLNNKEIIFGDAVKLNSKNSEDTFDNVSRASQRKTRGRPKKQQEVHSFVEKCDETHIDDTSTYSRSQRAAAQAAGHKLAQVQSLMKATKLRRPTDFDERQSARNKGSSPPSKSRKTYRKQSAGSSHSQDTDETSDIDNKEKNVKTEDISFPQNTHEINGTVKKENNIFTEDEAYGNDDSEKKGVNTSEHLDSGLKNGCSVQLEKLTNSAIKALSKQKSSEKPLRKRKSSDIFVESISLGNSPLSIESKSPLSENLFKGFDQKDAIKPNILRNNIVLKEVHSDSEVLDIKRNEVKQQVLRKTMFISKKENITEVEQSEVIIKKTKTELSRKKTNQDKTNKHVLDSENVSDEVNIIMSNNKGHVTKQDLKSQPECNGFENNLQVCHETRKKSDSENESPEIILRSRTKVIKKHTEIQVLDDGCHTRTKTLKKSPQHNDTNNLKPLKTQLTSNDQNNKLGVEVYMSPIQNKGELVKKRIEDFERMKSGLESGKEETNTGRITRHTARNKIAPSSELHASRNVKLVSKSTERARLTPLGTQNRMTPAGDSRLIVVNKGLNSATQMKGQTLNENNTAFVQKQIIEEIEKKKKEDERLKRQAKEETAKKKKEKTLKATAEETRRKREEKLQKVAATREAAEKEKYLLALKAEKEKEEKMQQIAAEKEKQREEQLKKKQLAHQKALEHEERRKQEEAARLAKLREQEEEHKRILAMKERELELQKQQKTELRLAETEKVKYLQHGGKLGKLAAVNSANMKLQQVMTPAASNETYEMTPAREDRPLIEPKSDNDYGIDDANSEDSSDEECKPKKKIPLWAQPKNRQKLLVINDLLPKEIWSVFMECNANPDVNQIFAGNQIKKRTRTSSAVWNTPPRYF